MSADLLSVTVHVTNTFAGAHLAYLPTIVRQGDFRNQHRNYGSVAKFDFCGEIEKLSPINSMSYVVTNSSKTNFATEPGVSVRTGY
jgi:hypothetical protein